MSVFDKIFKRGTPAKPTPRRTISYELLKGWQPTFTSYQGSLYEAQLIRSSVDAIARNAAKFSVDIITSKQTRLMNYLRHQPNDNMTWSQFLYRLVTILELNNTAFIVPVFSELGEITGYYPVLPTSCQIVAGKKVTNTSGVWNIEDTPAPWLVYRLRTGDTESVPMSLCCVLTRFQYNHDFFGETNAPLNDTLNLIHMQNQAINESIKNSAAYKWAAQLANFSDPDDIRQEAERFTNEYFSDDADSKKIMLFPSNYKDIKQISAGTQYVVDAQTMQNIRTDVYNYFGVNDAVLQNKLVGDTWDAFYEGCLEPIAIQISETFSRALFSDRERSSGSQFMLTSNRLQYMTNSDKLRVTKEMSDRGIFNRDECREIFNMPPIPNDEGKAYIIRGEYKNASQQINDTDDDDDKGEGNDE